MEILNAKSNRRVSRRRSLDEIPELIAVKVQSEEVAVVNASRSGILIECGLRLPPGTAKQLEFHNLDGLLRVRGQVVRCEVSKVTSDRLIYRVAFAFNKEVDFINDEDSIARSELEKTTGHPFPIQTPEGIEIIEIEGFALNSW